MSFGENTVADRTKKVSLWIKIYVTVLFFCSAGIWFSIDSVRKQKMSAELALDKKVVDILVANGIVQNDILIQYVRERNRRMVRWNEFYKTVELKSSKTAQFFETNFRAVAQSMKMSLSKTNNTDGSVTYKFYLPNRNYYNITFVGPKKS
jgi:hypothetical protein